MFTTIFPAFAQSSRLNAINTMEAQQIEMKETLLDLTRRVNGLHFSDPKKEDAVIALDKVKLRVDSFGDLDASGHVTTSNQPDDLFMSSYDSAVDAINDVNRIFVTPTRPGNVPAGDIVEDFIPQIIRLLFQFAWLAILISLVVSGIMMIVSLDNEERVTKARQMLYFSLMGFAVVTLAFAIVKAVTDIDFFRFI